jgi:hypothetical protein
MEREFGWRNLESAAAVDAAGPVDNEVDVEDKVTGPILLVRVTYLEFKAPDVAIVPR